MQAGGGAGGDGGGAATYRGLRRRAPLAAMGDINVTPLVDVVLVLLLVFMITAPMMSRGIDVTLPTANYVETKEDNRITVTVDADGRTYLEGQPLHILLLEDRIRGMMTGREKKVVYLKADERLKYGRVIEVVDTLKKAGVEQIGFVYVLPKERAAS